MNIIVQDNHNLRKIIVQALETKEDIDSLLSSFTNTMPIEISFLNIQSLPKIIIIELKRFIDSLKIITNESTLKSYLMNLGFEVIYLNHYQSEKNKSLDLQVLALGGSAGSLSKFCDIVSSLPKSTISVFIIMHQKADEPSKLSNILQTCTEHYKVQEAKSDQKVEPATIYTVQPGKHLLVINGFIFLTDHEKRNFSRPSISTTFESLSNEYKNGLLAILVCGYGEDGSDALECLQNNHSSVIVEEPKECKATPMLTNAIKTNNVDSVLPIKDINEFIALHISNELFTKTELNNFLEKIYMQYGYDYRGYSLKHIKRRIHLFYHTLQSQTFSQFEQSVLKDTSIFRDLFLNISVNVTTFYRNPSVFKRLREEILPKLDSFLDIKIWCAGCSSGEEPYSIAIILKELGLLSKSLIYATDLNEIILDNAKNGIFAKEGYDEFRSNYYKSGGDESFSKYFVDHQNFVEIKDEIKENILFFKHNLVLDGKINDFQLIFCRNVLIYFDADLKAKVFKLFDESLDNYGFLVLGESESIHNHNRFQTLDEKHKIYKRKI